MTPNTPRTRADSLHRRLASTPVDVLLAGQMSADYIRGRADNWPPRRRAGRGGSGNPWRHRRRQVSPRAAALIRCERRWRGSTRRQSQPRTRRPRRQPKPTSGRGDNRRSAQPGRELQRRDLAARRGRRAEL